MKSHMKKPNGNKYYSLDFGSERYYKDNVNIPVHLSHQN